MRTATVAALLALTCAACGAAGAAAEPEATQAPTATVRVERRDLVESAEFDGTLGYGEQTAVAGSRSGTVTALPTEGSVVERGGVLAEVDATALRLFYGSVPAYRALDGDASDGADIRQLEENLAALGYFDEQPDDDFDGDTRAAVRDWQDDLGVDDTGAVALGDVAFLPGPVRVAGHAAAVGAQTGPGQSLVSVTGTERLVAVDLPAEDRDLVSEGLAVGVELPGGTTVPGTVRRIGRVASTPPDDAEGEASVDLEVALDDPAAGGDLDAAPVTVAVEREAARGVLAVPVRALLALDDGGYAVERPGGALVAVDLGAFADGWVEVTGDLAEGDEVVVPA